MKKLYTVELSTKVVVYAESLQKAENLALDAHVAEESFKANAAVLEYLPPDWRELDIPYGPTKGRTIKQIQDELKNPVNEE